MYITQQLTRITFLKFFLRKKSKNKPNKNKASGILFPDNKIPMAKIHIVEAVNIIFEGSLFFLIKLVKKSIEKKEKFCMYPPAITSSPKKT